MKLARRLVIPLVAVLGGVLAWHYYARPLAPAGQPPLIEISASNLDRLRGEFNQAAGDVRVILLLSPT